MAKIRGFYMEDAEFIVIEDNREFDAKRSTDGGCYGFTTTYYRIGENAWNAVFETTSGMPFCSLCGSFYSGGSCSCDASRDLSHKYIFSDCYVMNMVLAAITLRDRGEEVSVKYGDLKDIPIDLEPREKDSDEYNKREYITAERKEVYTFKDSKAAQKQDVEESESDIPFFEL